MSLSDKKNWHSIDIESVFDDLSTGSRGLDEEEAQSRLEKYGLNELREETRVTPLELFLDQFKSALVLILIASAIISAYIAMRNGEPLIDTYVILAIVIMNSVLGFVQEYRAEKAIEALKKMVSPHVIVFRDGREKSIDSKELVPGDVILLEAGSRIPADARLLEAVNLRVDESSLTGESTPVAKRMGVLPSELGISDRVNTIFTGTLVTGGRSVAVVIETGMNTEFGKIAGMVQSVDVEPPPLKQKMEKLGRMLCVIAIVLCIFVFFTGVVRQLDLEEMFMTSVSLAVSAIPEGLPAVLTITLALGVTQMTRRNAIVRKLASVETLGSTTIICSDKTGTLTRNEMTVVNITSGDRFISVTGAGYDPKGEFNLGDDVIDPIEDKDLELLLRIGYLNNDAHLQDNDGAWGIFGDPTEGALTVLGAKAGFSEELKEEYPRKGEFPFDSTRKMMSTIHLTPDGYNVAYVKGAPETILSRSEYIQEKGVVRPLSDVDRERILKKMQNMAGDALRVLAMSYKEMPAELENNEMEEVESGLTYVGMVGMIDPPRDEVLPAIQTCKAAGIKTVMVTGDHRLTAVAIAKQIGMLEEENPESVMTGVELENTSDDELDEIVENITVFARVSPEHKVRIAQSLKRRGHIVAMTGDGVNDAPALKTADIGIAMGITGTDVAKEASDMVLEDDNFATIVSAVESGRIIYDNIRKFLRYMISSNFDEMLVISTFVLMGFPSPFLPTMILWLNLVTDGGPAVALSMDTPTEDLMSVPPRNPKHGVLHGMTLFIAAYVILQSGTTAATFYWKYAIQGSPLNVARTAAFMQACIFELMVVWNCRSERHNAFKVGFFTNKYLLISSLGGIVLTISLCYVPFLQVMFKTVPLGIYDWLWIFSSSLLGFLVLPEIFFRTHEHIPGMEA